MRRLVTVGLLAVMAASGISPTTAHAATVSTLAVVVSPSSSLADQVVHVAVHGLARNELVTVTLASTDADDVQWHSTATFRANDEGVVDLDHAKSIAGSYRGVLPMGLLDSFAASDASGYSLYYWHDSKPLTFTVTVRSGTRVIATTSFERSGAASGVTVHNESIAATGFFGQFWTPPTGTARHLAILEFGGSEGGLSGALLAGDLASAGYQPPVGCRPEADLGRGRFAR